jgi:hypothetical protein
VPPAKMLAHIIDPMLLTPTRPLPGPGHSFFRRTGVLTIDHLILSLHSAKP